MRTSALIAAFCLFTPSLFAADQGTAPANTSPPAHVKKVEKAPNFIPAKADPLLGDWQGAGGVVAQVYLTPTGDYQANLLKAFDTENNLITVLHGVAADGIVKFTGDGCTATVDPSHFKGTKDADSFDLQHITRASPTLGQTPPKGAIVLFDGTNLDAWSKKAGKDWLTEDGPPKWKLVDGGAVEIIPGSDSLITRQKFGDCHLHVEFRTIGFPSKSAVFLEARYEANINETYGHTDGNMTGGLDNSTEAAHPKVRAALPPLVWQTFDIDFRAPRFDAGGNKTEKAKETIVLNGVKLYDNQELDLPHGAAGRLGEAATGPVMLQDHLTPLQYRNIWIVEGNNQ
jgi:hypothetical protein